jgi:hypothetical protein
VTGPFDGRDLLVGEITAIRTFDLRSDGTLWPVFAAERPWTDGDNTAGCRRHQAAGAPGCKCGFWAYGTVRALRDQPAARNVAAVVSCWGRVTPGTRGLRAQYARLDAIWLSPRVADELVAQVAATYPQAQIFRDRAAMLTAHPLTVMASYRLPDRRPWRLVAARLVFQAVFGASLLVGLLPRASFDDRWLPPLRTQLAEVLVYLILAAAFRYVVDRPAGASRTHYTRLVFGAAALLAWVWAPNAIWSWQLLLRVPVLVWGVRFLLGRTVRFVPTRATPPPGG